MVYLAVGYFCFWIIIFLYILKLVRVVNRLETELKYFNKFRKEE